MCEIKYVTVDVKLDETMKTEWRKNQVNIFIRASNNFQK